MATDRERRIRNPKSTDVPDDPDTLVNSGAENGDRQPQEVKKKRLKRITLTVPEDLHKSVHIYARQNDITVTKLVTNYLKELIAQQ